MTTANLTVIGNVLFKRGNTVTAGAYTGVPGEIIIDTTLQTIRIQDGVTAGGHVLASAQDAANIAGFGANISTLLSNAASQGSAISALQSNVAVLQSGMANVTTYGLAINLINANVTAANAAITSLQSNAATQAQDIGTLQANAALQASLIDTLTGNAATQGGVLNDLVANAASQSVNLTELIGNAITQTNELSVLVSNASTQSTAIDNLWANAATQTTQIDLINSNIANVAPSLTNGAYQFKLQANGNVTTNSDSFFITPANTTIGIKTTGTNGEVKIGWTNNGDQATVTYDTDGIEFHTTDAGVQRYWRFRVNGATEFPLFAFPAGSGAAGQRLSTNGAGQLYWDTPANLQAESGNITANQDAVYSLGEPNKRWKSLYSANIVVGSAGHQFLPNSVAEFSGNVDSYSQINFRNQNSGTSATTDYILTANNGTDTEYYLDVGIAGSGYDNTDPLNSLGNVVSGNDGYIYVQGNTSSSLGGNLAIGTTTAGKHVSIFAGGVNDTNEVAKFDSNGVKLAGNISSTRPAGLTVGSNYNVYIVADQTDNNRTWTFDGSNGELHLPQNGALRFSDSTIFNGNTFTSPETNGILKNFKWEFSDLSSGADTVTLQWNLLDTTLPQWYLTTNSQGNIYVFDGDAKTIGFLDNSINSGTVTFGTAANNGAGGTNDIELTTVAGNAYIRTSTNSWKFDVNGNLTIPGNVNYANGVSILSGLGGAVTGNISVDTSAIQFVASSSGDGNGYSTIRMIPDTNLEGTDQYVIIDPTAPGHIHIRAGGTQDNSGADLILGGENSHVKVTAGSNPPVYIQANNQSWTFTTDGVFQTPGGITLQGNIQFADSTVQTTAWTGSVTFGNTIAIGYNTGTVSQGGGAVAIGSIAGNVSQGVGAVAVGEASGRLSQGTEGIAVGKTAGEQSQGAYSIAIGSATGYYQQGLGAVAIGTSAGALQQGTHAIAIGTGAGNALQGNNSIILNATGSTLDQTTANTFTVAPIRNVSTTDGVLQYNATTKEVSYSSNTTLGVLKIDDGVHEKFQTKSNATGTVIHDCSGGHIFYHTLPSANWTSNFTNLNLSSGYATTVTLVVEQGATGYYPSAVEIGGSAVPLAWQGNTTPTPSSNRIDVVTFSILNDGLYTVLGQLTGF
jgi:hypothetical protein